MTALIRTRRPVDVASEVEEWINRGATEVIVASIDGGGMLDLERLGAARYAAGRRAHVELESAPPSEALAR